MAVCLIPIEDGPAITLDRPIVFVGRHADCDVRIDSKKISRRHCCLVQLDDRLVIRDLGSTNGVYHNGERVEEAELRPHDEVQIANYRYKIVVNESSSKENGRTRAPEQGGAGAADHAEPKPMEPPLPHDA